MILTFPKPQAQRKVRSIKSRLKRSGMSGSETERGAEKSLFPSRRRREKLEVAISIKRD